MTRRGIGMARLASCVCLMVLVGCQGAPPSAPPTEGTVSLDGGRASVHLAQRAVHIGTADGRALGALTILVGGQAFTVKNGSVMLPDALVRAARAGGSMIVLAPGYAPEVVKPGNGDLSFDLAPAVPVGSPARLGPTGGRVGDAGGVTANLPAGMLAASTQVALSTYHPAIDLGDTAAFNQERAALLAKIPGASAGCNAPLPCPPASQSLGFLLTVDGALTPQKIAVNVDLSTYLAPGADAASAAAARQILATFAAIDQTGNPAYRAELQAEYGITLAGQVLTVVVDPSTQPLVEGTARIDVDAVRLLGVKLEVTVVSTLAGASEPGFAPAGSGTGGLVGASGGGTGTGASTLTTVPSPDANGNLDLGALAAIDGPPGLLSNNGSAIVSDNGAAIISDHGGTLVGSVYFPMQQPIEAKLSLLALPGVQSPTMAASQGGYTEYLWPLGAKVRAATTSGIPLTDWVPVDAAGKYKLDVPDYKGILYVEATALGATGPQDAPAYERSATLVPGAGKTASLDVNTANTSLSSWLKGCLQEGDALISEVNMPGVPPDEGAMAGFIPDQTTAVEMATKPVSDVRDLTSDTMDANAYAPLTLRIVATTIVGDNPGYADGAAGATAVNAPQGVATGPFGALLVADTGDNCIRTIGWRDAMQTLAGTTTPGFVDGFTNAARFNAPAGVAMGPDGSVYVADTGNGALRRIGGGRVQTVVKNLSRPVGVVVDGSGNVYVSLPDANQILRITPMGVQTTIGSGAAGSADGPVATASFKAPMGLAVDTSGNVVVADSGNAAIREISGGTVKTLLAKGGPQPGGGTSGFGFVGPAVPGATLTVGGPGWLIDPIGVAVDAKGQVFVSDAKQYAIMRLPAGGSGLTVIAGVGVTGHSDGTGNLATFASPAGLALDSHRDVVVADTANNAVRRVTP